MKLKSLAPTTTGNFKHSLDPHQINVRPRTKSLISSGPITTHTTSDLQQSMTSQAERQQKSPKRQSKLPNQT